MKKSFFSLILLFTIQSQASVAEKLYCSFNFNDIKIAQFKTNRGFEANKLQNGYIDVEYKNDKEYIVSSSIVPANASFSVGPTAVPSSSKIIQNIEVDGNKIMTFDLQRRNNSIGKLSISINPKTKKFSIDWHQKGDDFWIGYDLHVLGTCQTLE